MFANLDIFRMSHAMAVHAGQMQAIAAENVANSDTPEFKARDIAKFSELYAPENGVNAVKGQRATRIKHLHGSANESRMEPFPDPQAIESPNGNTVSLENEMLKSLNAKRQHDRALAIYRSSLNVLRASLSRS